MKIRTGFISNSSSSSFILYDPDDFDLAKRHGIKSYEVKYLIEAFERMNNLLSLVEKIAKVHGPSFLFEDFEYLDSLNYYRQLLEIEKKRPGCHITEEFDRDEAYKLDFNFETFETDL